MDKVLDVLYAEETRPRNLRLVLKHGVRFVDESNGETMFRVGAKELCKVLIDQSADNGDPWGKALQRAWPK